MPNRYPTIPYGSLRGTTYGPGSPGATWADRRELFGNNDQLLGQGDAALSPGTASRYGLNIGDKYNYGGQVYSYNDTPATRVGNVNDVYYPGAGISFPGSGAKLGDRPGDPVQAAMNPQDYPGTPTVEGGDLMPGRLSSAPNDFQGPPMPDNYGSTPENVSRNNSPDQYQMDAGQGGPDYGQSWQDNAGRMPIFEGSGNQLSTMPGKMPYEGNWIDNSFAGKIPQLRGLNLLWKLGGSLGNLFKGKLGQSGGGFSGFGGLQNTGNGAPIRTTPARPTGFYGGRAPYTDPRTGETVMESLGSPLNVNGRGGPGPSGVAYQGWANGDTAQQGLRFDKQGNPYYGGGGNFGDIPGGSMDRMGNIGSGEPGGSGGYNMWKMSGGEVGNPQGFLSEHPEVKAFINSMGHNAYGGGAGSQNFLDNAAAQLSAARISAGIPAPAMGGGNVMMPSRLGGMGAAPIVTHAVRKAGA